MSLCTVSYIPKKRWSWISESSTVPSHGFFQAKNIQRCLSRCLKIPCFFLNCFKFFNISIGPMAPFFGNPGNPMHSTSKNTVFAETARSVQVIPLDIQALHTPWGELGVLGYMFFWGPVIPNLRSCFWMSRVLNRIFVAKRSSKTTLDAERNFGSPLLKAA